MLYPENLPFWLALAVLCLQNWVKKGDEVGEKAWSQLDHKAAEEVWVVLRYQTLLTDSLVSIPRSN